MTTVTGQPVPAVRLRRATRVISAALLLLAALYVSMPLWLPTGWLARRLVHDLSTDLDREVHIDAIRVGWISGITLENVTIAERPDFPNAYLARVGRIRCPFTPLTTLMTERVAQVEVSDAELWVARDADGRLNLEAGLTSRRQGRLPSLNYLILRAACHIVTPETDQTIRIDRLECELEPPTGLLRLFGQAVVRHSPDTLQLASASSNLQASRSLAESPPAGRFSLHARLRVPRLKRDEVLRGDVRVEWTGLAMNDLPLGLIPRLPMEQVRGSTDGYIHLAANPDLTVDYGLSLAFNGVQVMREGQDRPAEVPDATLRCDGHWDPNPLADVIILRNFEYETQAIHLSALPPAGDDSTGGGAVVEINADPDVPFRLECAGRVKDWVALRREFPEIDAYLRNLSAECTGSADFRFSLAQSATGGEVDRIELAVDGGGSGIVVAGEGSDYLSAAAGVPKSLQVEMLYSRQTRRMTQPKLRVVLGDLEVDVENGLTLPELPRGDLPAWLAEVAPTINSRMQLRTPHMEQVLPLLPVLLRWPGVAEWSGPLEVTARVVQGESTQGPASTIDLNLAMEPETNFRIGDWFHKPAGKPFAAGAGARIAHAGASSLEGLTLTVSSGPARIHLDSDRAHNAWRFSFLKSGQPDTPVALTAGWELPLRIERVEELLELSPQWQARKKELPELAGSMTVTTRGRASLRPDDWLVSHEVELEGDELALRWGHQLDKLAGDPLTVAAVHQWQVLAGEREQFISARLTQPAGELYAALAFAGVDSDDLSDDFEHVTLQADVHDVPELLRLAPALAELAKVIMPVGTLHFQMGSLLVDGQQTLSLTADATAADFAIPSLPELTKSAGTAAMLDMKWRSEPSATSSEQSWHLVDGAARLGGLQLEHAAGRITTDWRGEVVADPATPPGGVLSRRGQEAVLSSIALELNGRVELDEDTLALHPELARWGQEFELGGRGDWNLRLQAGPGRVDLAGRIGAEALSAAVSLGHDLLPALRKPEELPASLDFDLSLVQPEEPGAYVVELRDVTADLDGRRVTAEGTLAYLQDASGTLQLADVELSARAALNDLAGLLPLLPGNRLSALEGRVDAAVQIRREGEEVRVALGDVLFHDFAVGAGGEPIRLHGRGDFTGGHAALEQLRWSWGKSGGVASGILSRADGRHSGHIGLAVDHFYLEDFLKNLGSLPVSAASAEHQEPMDLMGLLRSSNVIVDLYADTLDLLLPLDVRITADAASARAAVEDGAVSISFSCAVDGGYVTGTFATDAREADPVFDLEYTAERIQPGAVVDTYLALTFPGMKATGPLTLIDSTRQRLLPGPGEANPEIGKGEIIIEGGTVAGRAAPLWMTRIFPGLNFATFEFTHMHSWFDKRPDGRIHHQMIFKGNIYNIYMIGYNDPEGRIRYEVGVDFLADFDSKYWADVGQGRVPLFIKTGHMQPDGTLADERVTYMPAQRILDTLFVKNNPIVTAYHAVRKRVLKQQ